MLRRLRASGSIGDDDASSRLGAVVGGRDLRTALTALVESALRDDDPRYRRIIVQSDIEGRPGKAIAAELYVSERTYYRLRASALAGLQRSFVGRLNEPGAATSSDALSAYGRGLRLGTLRTRASLSRALACFEAALTSDPHFVRAYAGMADVQLLAAEYLLQDPRQAYGEAAQALEAALECDPRSAEANAVAGDFALYARRDRVAARSRFDAALESDPLYAMTYQYAAWLSLNERNPERAARECAAGLALRPDSMPLQTTLGVAYLELGRTDRAVEHLGAVLEAEPGYWLARFHLAAALTEAGRYAEALQELEELAGDDPHPTVIAAAGHVRGLLGDSAGALRAVATVDAMATRERAPFEQRAIILAGVGRHREAVAELRDAAASAAPWPSRQILGTSLVAVRTYLRPLREAPDFEAVYERYRSA